MSFDPNTAEAWRAGYQAGDCDSPANLNPYTGKSKVQAIAWNDGWADAQFKKHVGRERFTQGEKIRLVFDWAIMVAIFIGSIAYLFMEIV